MLLESQSERWQDGGNGDLTFAQFSVKIAPKPGGGYISTSDNPELVCEGATEQEVEQKVAEKLNALAGPAMASIFTNLEHGVEELEKSAGVPQGNMFSVSVNRRTSFSFNSKKPGEGDPAPGVPLLGTSPKPFADTRTGMSSGTKILIALLILVLVGIVFSVLRR